MIKSLPYILLLLVLCSSTDVIGQQKKPAPIARIERAFDEHQSEWKVVRKHIIRDVHERSPRDSFFTSYRVNLELKSADRSALVSVTYWKVSQNALDVFQGHAMAFDNSSGSNMTKTKVPGIGDENYMWTVRGGDGHTTIHFRKDHIHAVISSPSVQSAERFARLLADSLQPPNKGTQRPRS